MPYSYCFNLNEMRNNHLNTLGVWIQVFYLQSHKKSHRIRLSWIFFINRLDQNKGSPFTKQRMSSKRILIYLWRILRPRFSLCFHCLYDFCEHSVPSFLGTKWTVKVARNGCFKSQLHFEKFLQSISARLFHYILWKMSCCSVTVLQFEFESTGPRMQP